MSIRKTFVFGIIAIITLMLGVAPQSFAVGFLPDFPLIPISFTPAVQKTTPTSNERIVYSPISSAIVPQITVLFDQNIEVVAEPASSAIKLYNTTDSVQIYPTSVRSLGNALIINTGGLTVNKNYQVDLYGSAIRSTNGSWYMDGTYTWAFSTVRVSSGGFLPGLSEPHNANLLVEKNAITPTVNMIGTADTTAKYRITVQNEGAYNLSSVDILDILPSGFSFNSLTAGDASGATGTRIIHFTIPNVASGTSKRVEFLVNIDGDSTSSGDRIVPAGTYNNTVIATGTFTPSGLWAGEYLTPVISGANNGELTTDNLTITRTGLIVPTSLLTIFPTFTFIPTSTSTPSPTATPTIPATPTVLPTSTGFSHPVSDPLTCLRLNGATALSFSDVSASAVEAPYVNFLNTTVFNSTPDVRLSRGYADGSFGMNNTLTRFELTKMALGANCVNYTSSPTRNSFFTDVSTDDSEMSWVIGKARALGIVQGVGNQFYPNRPVSYGEMVKILVGSGTYFDHGSARAPLTHMLTGITDESFRQFAEHAARMNLVNLAAGNSFPQNEFVLRRSMAQAVARYIAWLKNIALV